MPTWCRGWVLVGVMLAGCGSSRALVRVENQSQQAIEVVLEERHPSYPSSNSLPTRVEAGDVVELWWDQDFESAVIIRRDAQQLGRHPLDPEIRQLVHSR